MPHDCSPVLKALVEPTRWEIVKLLMRDAQTVGELESALHTPQYSVSKHLKVLRETGIVKAERDGLFIIYSISPRLRKRIGELDFGCCQFVFD